MKKIESPKHSVIEEIASSMLDTAAPLVTASLGMSSPGEVVSSVIMNVIKLPMNLARDRKLNKFFDEVVNKVNKLNDVVNKQESMLQAILARDEDFTEIFVNAAVVAMYQGRKIEILSEAVANSAIKKDVEHEQQIQFILYVRDLTVLQITLLKSFLDNETSLSNIKSYKDLYNFFSKNVFPTINISSIHKDEFRANCNTLSNYYLLNIPTEFSEVYASYLVAEQSEDYEDVLRVTTVGKNFIKFISKQSEGDCI